MTGAIPPDVLSFLAEQIDTVPHLEVLLLLAEAPEQEWSEDLVAARIYTTRETAAALLNDLHHRGLVRTAGSPPRYEYDPAWDHTGLMQRVSATYRRQLVQVATYIHSKASSSVREFARAFDFKKDR